jgi:hypothetical protein
VSALASCSIYVDVTRRYIASPILNSAAAWETAANGWPVIAEAYHAWV